MSTILGPAHAAKYPIQAMQATQADKAKAAYDALHIALKAKHGSAYRLGSSAAMKLEPNSAPADVDDAIADMLLQISEAETKLQMARNALEGFGRYPSTLTARSLMNEACDYLAVV